MLKRYAEVKDYLTGDIKRVEFSELKYKDVFVVYEPDGTYTNEIFLAVGHIIPLEDGNYGIEALRVKENEWNRSK